jgi:hypothetical protein
MSTVKISKAREQLCMLVLRKAVPFITHAAEILNTFTILPPRTDELVAYNSVDQVLNHYADRSSSEFIFLCTVKRRH